MPARIPGKTTRQFNGKVYTYIWSCTSAPEAKAYVAQIKANTPGETLFEVVEDAKNGQWHIYKFKVI